ncbi:hypothetical protein ACSU6B_16480 [Neobacillus sp. C211]|uniref:hypothetical protein n=1 Tax=unclassified Neobacillus TaxID=2675272 RepID=UPI00397E87AE
MLSACEGGSKETGRQTKDKNEKVLKIGITQIVEHPSLESAREGFIAALVEHSHLMDVTITI